jgi:hypothetical protein
VQVVKPYYALASGSRLRSSKPDEKVRLLPGARLVVSLPFAVQVKRNSRTGQLRTDVPALVALGPVMVKAGLAPCYSRSSPIGRDGPLKGGGCWFESSLRTTPRTLGIGNR